MLTAALVSNITVYTERAQDLLSVNHPADQSDWIVLRGMYSVAKDCSPCWGERGDERAREAEKATASES
jgi:hypothetical protein